MLPVGLYEWKTTTAHPILTIMFKNVSVTFKAEILQKLGVLIKKGVAFFSVWPKSEVYKQYISECVEIELTFTVDLLFKFLLVLVDGGGVEALFTYAT